MRDWAALCTLLLVSAQLEPHVSDAPSVSGKVVELVQSIEVVDWNLSDGFRLCEAKVHSDAGSALVTLVQRTPEGHTTAVRAEVKFDGFATDIRFCWTRDFDAFAFVVVDPQHAVSAANGAVAGCSPIGKGWILPRPVDRTAVA